MVNAYGFSKYEKYIERLKCVEILFFTQDEIWNQEIIKDKK